MRDHVHSIVVEVEGELDLASAPELERTLEGARGQRPGLMVLDLAKLRFIDMAGIRALLGAHRQAEDVGGQLLLANVRPPIRRAMTLARVGGVLRILENPG